MARPLRIEIPGALYHITTRGNAEGDIFLNHADRIRFLNQLAQAINRYDWCCHAYCLMDNHYHLLIETGTATLSKGMKYLNGSYTQSFNRLYQRTGRVFQGRYKAILVEKESFLLELSRYIVLNPVRAGMVRSAKDWRWSSYRATAGQTDAHPCLTIEGVLSVLGKRRSKTQEKYRAFVAEGRHQPSPWKRIKNQIYLGSDLFVENMRSNLGSGHAFKNVSGKQKQAEQRPLSDFAQKGVERNKAMAKAYLSRQYTLEQVGDYFGCSYATVSRAVKVYEAQM